LQDLLSSEDLAAMKTLGLTERIYDQLAGQNVDDGIGFYVSAYELLSPLQLRMWTSTYRKQKGTLQISHQIE
jgi:hypothetical protein